MPKESITLYYREGSSDKVYQASIEDVAGGFVVNFAYGRRGSTLTTGTKTQSAVSFDEAKTIYDKLVKSKTDKGYTPGEDGTPYQHTDKESRATGFLPQLCNAIEDDDFRKFLSDPSYWLQEKFDGKRVLLYQDDAGLFGINRKGLSIGLPSPIVVNTRAIKSKFVLDGECVGDVYHAFDILTLNGEDLRAWPYKDRHAALANLLAGSRHPYIELVPTVTKPLEKPRRLMQLRGGRREGVVFKQITAPYTSGRPSSGGTWLKHKFTVTGSFIVSTINSQRSVGLEVFDGTERVQVGNVTIPPNKSVPVPGSIIETRYLYAFKGGCIYQPVFLTVRDDLVASDCVISQLKYKRDDADQDEG